MRRCTISSGRHIGAKGVSGALGRALDRAVGTAAGHSMRISKGLSGRAIRARKDQRLFAVSNKEGFQRAAALRDSTAAFA